MTGVTPPLAAKQRVRAAVARRIQRRRRWQSALLVAAFLLLAALGTLALTVSHAPIRAHLFP